VEQSPHWKADSTFRWTINSLPLMVHYRIHKRPLTVITIESQVNLIHTCNHISMRSLVVLSSHLCLAFSNGVFPSDVPIEILYAFLNSCAGYMTCPSRPPWFDNPNNIWRRMQIIELLITHFSPPSCHFTPLGILKSTLLECHIEWYLWEVNNEFQLLIGFLLTSECTHFFMKQSNALSAQHDPDSNTLNQETARPIK
jgi:hypothetical protein